MTKENSPLKTADSIRLRSRLKSTDLLRIALFVALGCSLTIMISGCSGSSQQPATSASTPAAPASKAPQTPGVSGLIAAVSGKTLQVQGRDGQTAVTYTNTTVITETASGTFDDLSVGGCVIVQSTEVPSESPAQQNSSNQELSAASVSVVEARDGSCTAFGGPARGGETPGSLPSGRPSSIPSDAPSRGGDGAGQQGTRPQSGAAGKIISIASSSFTIESTMGSGDQDHIIKVTSDTTYSVEKKATAQAISQGKCATAEGKTDDTGALTATTLSLRSAVDGECATGFERGGFGRNGAGFPSGAPGFGSEEAGNGRG